MRYDLRRHRRRRGFSFAFCHTSRTFYMEDYRMHIPCPMQKGYEQLFNNPVKQLRSYSGYE